MVVPREIIPITVPGERHGSGSVRFNKQGVEGTRKWVVPWSNPDGTLYYVNFVQQLLGMTITGPTGLPSVTYPDAFSGDFPFLYCHEADVEGEDLYGVDRWGRARYRRAIITAKYAPYEATESFQLSAQALSMQEGSFQYLGPASNILPPPPPFIARQGSTLNNFTPQVPDPTWVQTYNQWLTSTRAKLVAPGATDDDFGGTATKMSLRLRAGFLIGGNFRLQMVIPDGAASEAIAAGTYFSAVINFDATAQDVADAIQAGLGVPAPLTQQVVEVAGGPLTGGPFDEPGEFAITLIGDLAGKEVPAFTVVDSTLTYGGPEAPTNQMFLKVLDGLPTGGTYNIRMVIPAGTNLPAPEDGTYETANIPWDATAADIQDFLMDALGLAPPLAQITAVSGGNLSVEAGLTITLIGSAASKAIPTFTISDDSLTYADPFAHVVIERGSAPTGRLSAELTQLGKGGFANGAIGQPLTKMVPMGEYSLERTQVLVPQFWSYVCMLGCVNAYYFLGFPPWTLLFSGMDGKKTVLPNGSRSWTCHFKFHFNPNSWNMIYRPERSRWELVAAVGLSAQTFWTLGQALIGQPAELQATENKYHSWLYRPVDFSTFLLFS